MQDLLLRLAAIVLALSIVNTGCTADSSVGQKEEDSTAESGKTTATNGETADNTTVASTPTSVASDNANTPDEVPNGYILEESCQSGLGNTGKTIYYRVPSSGPYRFACVHKVDRSPDIRLDEEDFYTELADISGNHCAFSTVDGNVGCALSVITENDLMQPPTETASPPTQAGVPAGYVLDEGCQHGIGATGKTIYYRPPLEPNTYGPLSPMHAYLYECVHPAGGPPPSLVSPNGPQMQWIQAGGNPYCAYSRVDHNIGCALEPITSKDLMNPS